jgi:oxalate decarboxylase/phosphoglucose isomerase-like protein (cupin superfamily)
VKSNDIYDIHDLKLNHLTVSTTRLHSGKETRGHTHPGDQEEIYICLEGSGKIIIGEVESSFEKGDLLAIESGEFHKVINDSETDLVFLCVFEKYERK